MNLTFSRVLNLNLIAGFGKIMAKRWNVVFVLGPPGSGKGTQCKRISSELKWVHLSAGDLLRSEQTREGSELGTMIAKHIKEGTIVPVEVTCQLLENAMAACGDAPGFLVDGFPRNEDNLQGWVKQMSEKTDVKFVLFLDCSEDICVGRCLNRGEGRADDNEVSLRKRAKTYSENTLPIIQHYAAKYMVRRIDASADPIDVWAEVQKVFKSL